MSHAKNKVEWCLKKAEREMQEGHKHRGLIKVEPSAEKAREHIEKAEHNLKAAIYLQKGGFTDWCSSTLFYTIYHCFLSILAKHGYESRNQECTFALIRSLAEDRKINISEEEIEKVSGLESEEKHESPTVVDIREEYQYTSKLSLEDKTLQNLYYLAENILGKAKVIIEQ